jgi:hypothetical protein
MSGLLLGTSGLLLGTTSGLLSAMLSELLSAMLSELLSVMLSVVVSGLMRCCFPLWGKALATVSVVPLLLIDGDAAAAFDGASVLRRCLYRRWPSRNIGPSNSRLCLPLECQIRSSTCPFATNHLNM